MTGVHPGPAYGTDALGNYPSRRIFDDDVYALTAARQRLVLGQVKVAEKSNEIVAPRHVGDRGGDRLHRRHGLNHLHREAIDIYR
jgi:hypothetical protein